MLFAAAAVERAMKIQEVIMRALSGAITWLQAADILGLDPRSVRRWRARYDAGGRALEHLGIEHIGAYSPQARGRRERLNRTVQGRLVNELALASITTRAAANAYLTERFIADYDDEFAHPPADPTPAFV